MTRGFRQLALATALCLAVPIGIAQANAVQTVTNNQELRAAIAAAGNTPTEIKIAGAFPADITIPAGANITLTGADADAALQQKNVNAQVIRVVAGGKLALRDGVSVVGAGGSNDNPNYGLISVFGDLEVGANATVRGARGLATTTAAIKVIGQKANFTLNGGTISDNQLHPQAGGAAGALYLADGAKAEIKAGKISDNGTAPNDTDLSSLAAGAIFANAGATLAINGGEIVNNRGRYAGAIALYSLPQDSADATQTAPVKATFSGGEVKNNSSLAYGGGFFIDGNAELAMSGGKITNNIAAEGGGGVNTTDECYYYRHDDEPLAGRCVSAQTDFLKWRNLFPAKFTMTGGEIRANQAGSTGGGVNISSDAVTLSGGTIAANAAGSQGGGVYVTTAPYTGRVLNALVTKNQATDNGGGFWSCPTGQTAFNVNQGVAIAANAATRAGADFSLEQFGKRTYPQFPGTAVLTSRALGGGKNAWYPDGWVEGMNGAEGSVPRYHAGAAKELETLSLNQPIALINAMSESGLSVAKNTAKLLITENKAERGGGIGTNGGVIFGKGEGTLSIAVLKQWELNSGAAATVPQPGKDEAAAQPPALIPEAGAQQGGAEQAGTQQTADAHADSADNNPATTGAAAQLPAPQRNTVSSAVKQNDAHELKDNIDNLEATKPAPAPGSTPSQTATDAQQPAQPQAVQSQATAPQEPQSRAKRAAGTPAATAKAASPRIPDSITLQLYRQVNGKSQIVQTFTVTKADDWKYVLRDLPRYDSDGASEVKYSLVEAQVAGFASTVGKLVENPDNPNMYQLVVTNKEKPSEPEKPIEPDKPIEPEKPITPELPKTPQGPQQPVVPVIPKPQQPSFHQPPETPVQLAKTGLTPGKLGLLGGLAVLVGGATIALRKRSMKDD